MTFTIGRRFLLAVVLLLVIAGAGAGGYWLGRGSTDVDGARERAEKAGKRAEKAAFKRGRAQGDEEGRLAIVERDNSKASLQEEADSDVIDYLGWERSDWKADRWYLVHMVTRAGDRDTKLVSVNDRTLMSPWSAPASTDTGR